MPRTPAPQTLDEAIELYRQGDLTVAEIVERTGVPKATLYYNLQVRGLGPTRQTQYRTGPRGPKITPPAADTAGVVHAMQRIEQLAARVVQLESVLEKHGIPVPTDGGSDGSH